MTKVSFARTPGAGESAAVAPSAPAADANATLTDAPAPASAQENAALAPYVAPAPTNALGLYDGTGDDTPNDPEDIRWPRINIVQGLSGADLKALGKDGTIIYNKAIVIPQPARIVVVGFQPKVWAETMPQFGMPGARTAKSLAEVESFGGTDQWKFSRECKDKDGVPVSRKPWFAPLVTGLLLIEKFDGAPEDLFPYVSDDGKAFAAAKYSVKSTSYSGFFVPIQSEQKVGLLRGGYSTHYIGLTAAIPARAKNPTYAPAVKILEATSAAVREMINVKILGKPATLAALPLAA